MIDSAANKAIAGGIRTLGENGSDALNWVSKKVRPITQLGADAFSNTAKGVSDVSELGSDYYEFRADTTEFLGDLKSHALEAVHTSIYDGTQAAETQFKQAVYGDEPELTEDTASWVFDNRQDFREAAILLNASPEVMQLAAMAVAEEYNRKTKYPNRTTDAVQDGIVALTGEIVTPLDLVKPDIGPGNINFFTAKRAIKKLVEDAQIRNSALGREIAHAASSDANLAKYMLTARGTAILATVIMQDSYARLEEYIRNHSDSFGDLSEQDRAQYHVNAWREGPGIYERLDKAIPKGKMLRHGNEKYASSNYWLIYNALRTVDEKEH
ncbi:MAG: hypothetical protein R3Y56_08620 [Akkermansia sp.]